eukprot:3637664-Prymnesium_polylepis.1
MDFGGSCTEHSKSRRSDLPLPAFHPDFEQTRGDAGEEEEEFDNAVAGFARRLISDDHLSDDEEDSDLAQQGFHYDRKVILNSVPTDADSVHDHLMTPEWCRAPRPNRGRDLYATGLLHRFT